MIWYGLLDTKVSIDFFIFSLIYLLFLKKKKNRICNKDGKRNIGNCHVWRRKESDMRISSPQLSLKYLHDFSTFVFVIHLHFTKVLAWNWIKEPCPLLCTPSFVFLFKGTSLRLSFAQTKSFEEGNPISGNIVVTWKDHLLCNTVTDLKLSPLSQLYLTIHRDWCCIFSPSLRKWG